MFLAMKHHNHNCCCSGDGRDKISNITVKDPHGRYLDVLKGCGSSLGSAGATQRKLKAGNANATCTHWAHGSHYVALLDQPVGPFIARAGLAVGEHSRLVKWMLWVIVCLAGPTCVHWSR